MALDSASALTLCIASNCCIKSTTNVMLSTSSSTSHSRLSGVSTIALLFVLSLSCSVVRTQSVYNLNEPDEEMARAGSASSVRRVFFWTDMNWKGDRHTLHLTRSRCYRIDRSADKKFSSVNTNGQCVELYTRDDCFGAMYRMEAVTSRCHRNLGDCDLNDAVSSVRLCKELCYYGQNGGTDGGTVSNKDLLRMLYELMRNNDNGE